MVLCINYFEGLDMILKYPQALIVSNKVAFLDLHAKFLAR